MSILSGTRPSAGEVVSLCDGRGESVSEERRSELRRGRGLGSLRCHRIMLPWYHVTMVPSCHGTIAPRCHGTIGWKCEKFQPECCEADFGSRIKISGYPLGRSASFFELHLFRLVPGLKIDFFEKSSQASKVVFFQVVFFKKQKPLLGALIRDG